MSDLSNEFEETKEQYVKLLEEKITILDALNKLKDSRIENLEKEIVDLRKFLEQSMAQTDRAIKIGDKLTGLSN